MPWNGIGRVEGLPVDDDGVGELELVVVCAASDKERRRGAIIAATTKGDFDFIDLGLVEWRINWRNLPS
jgi:hypothetical protein